MSRLISTVMLLVVTLVIAVLFYQVMVGFFVPLFLAALLVVIFRPVQAWIEPRMKGRRRFAAVLTTSVILLVVLLPAVIVLGVAAAQGTSLISRLNDSTFVFALERLRTRFGLEVKNIEPFEVLPQIVLETTQIESLADNRQRRGVEDRFREVERLLNILQRDYSPLDSAQEEAFAALRQTISAERGLLSEIATPQSAEGQSDPQGLLDRALTEEAEISKGPSANDESPIRFRSPEERFQRGLVQMDRQMSALFNALLGGRLRAQLVLFANPSREEIAERIDQLRTYLQPKIVRMTSATGEFLLQLVVGLSIMVITIYFFLVDGPQMIRTLMRLSPLDDRYEQKLLAEFDRTSRAVVLATILSALAQAVIATVGYYVVGLSSIALLFLLTLFMALIPFLGAAVVWLPCALWLALAEERVGAAIGLAIFGAVVVSSADNVVKIFVLHGRSQLHPLLALLSVLGGVQVFGAIGILVGPMVVVFLQTMLEILHNEFDESKESEKSLATTATAEGVSVTAGSMES